MGTRRRATAWLIAALLAHVASAAVAVEVVVDIGHDRENSGTPGASGTAEFDRNRAFAAELAAALQASGHGVTVYEAARGLALSDRVRQLKELGGDLILSIHHDSVKEDDLSWTDAFGARTRYTAKASGYSLFISAEDPGYQQALLFGQEIGGALVRGAHHPNLYYDQEMQDGVRILIDPAIALYRYDHLAVLRGPPVAGVLIEVAVIRNPLDEARAGDPDFRAAFIAAVIDGVERAGNRTED